MPTARKGPRTKVEEAVHGDGGDAFVRREPNDEVWIRWIGGEGRRFKHDHLRECIEYIELLGYSAWVQLRDSSGDGFVARVDANELFAGCAPGDTASQNGIPWEHLLDSLEEAVQA